MAIACPSLGVLLAVASATLVRPPSPHVDTDSIRRIAVLSTARAAHSATALQSGRVLVAGGMTGGAILPTAELVDPATKTVRSVGSMAEARSGHTATLLPNGRVLIAGGYRAGAYLRSVEAFNQHAETFVPSGTLLEERSGHTATLLDNGRVLIVGGIGRGWRFLRTAEIYDPITGRSERAGPMMESRESHTATLLADGRVLIIGGHTGRRPNVRLHASAEVFDPRTRQFESVGPLGTPRHKHDAVRLLDGGVLVVGGADATDRRHFATTELFDGASGTFRPGPTMSHPRYKIAGTAVLLPAGDILVAAGARVAEVLDAGLVRFREVPTPLPAAYRFAASALLPTGDVLVMGGYDDDNAATAGIWCFTRR